MRHEFVIISDYFNKYELQIVDTVFDLLLKTLPEPYRSEIKVQFENTFGQYLRNVYCLVIKHPLNNLRDI